LSFDQFLNHPQNSSTAQSLPKPPHSLSLSVGILGLFTMKTKKAKRDYLLVIGNAVE
jgi:hypothetical protein